MYCCFVKKLAFNLSNQCHCCLICIVYLFIGSVRDTSTSYSGILISIAIAVLSASVIFFFSFLLKKKPVDKGHFVGDFEVLHVPPITNDDFSHNKDVKVFIVSTKL